MSKWCIQLKISSIFAKSIYLKIGLILLIITIGYAIAYRDVLFSDPIWIYDVGTTITLEIKETHLVEQKTIVDEIMEDYLLINFERIIVRLDSLPYTYNPERFAWGILNFKMPYNLSVSSDGSEFKRAKFLLPTFISLRMIGEVENVLSSWDNITFRVKHYYVADLIDWYISYKTKNGTIILYLQWKKGGYIDGLNITFYNSEIKEFVFLVYAGMKAEYTQEIKERGYIYFGFLILIVLTSVFIGLDIRKGRKQKMINIYDELNKALERIDKYSKLYYRIWRILYIIALITSIPSLYLSSKYSDLIAGIVLSLVFGIDLALVILYGWMSNLFYIESEKICVKTFHLISPLVVFGIGLLAGGFLFEYIISEQYVYLILVLLVLLAISIVPYKLANAREEIEFLREEIGKKLKSAGILGVLTLRKSENKT